MTEREAIKLSLVTFEEINKLSVGENAICLPAEIDTAMDACRKVLAQPEQEPVAIVAEVHMSRYTIEWTNGPLPEGTKLYTTPPQPEQEPVIGTKTWFEDGKVVTQYLHPSDIYKDTEQEPWPDEPAGHTDGGVQPSKMTKSKAITAIYSLFNAPHNADINLTGLNKVLDELMAQPERDYERGFVDGMQKQMQSSVDKAVNSMARQWAQPEPVIDKSAAVRIATSLGWEPKRTWVGLTDEERQDIALEVPMDAVLITEAKLKEKNHG